MGVFLGMYIGFHANCLVVFQRHLSSVATSLAHNLLIVLKVSDIAGDIVDAMVEAAKLDPLRMQILHLLLLLLFELDLTGLLDLLDLAPLGSILHHDL